MYIGSWASEVLQAAMNICTELYTLEENTWQAAACAKLAPLIQQCELLQATLQEFMAEDGSTFKHDFRFTRKNLPVAIAGAAAGAVKEKAKIPSATTTLLPLRKNIPSYMCS